MSKWKATQKSNGLFIGVFTDQQKEAYESSLHTRGKYTFEEIKQTPAPKEAKAVKAEKDTKPGKAKSDS